MQGSPTAPKQLSQSEAAQQQDASAQCAEHVLGGFALAAQDVQRGPRDVAGSEARLCDLVFVRAVLDPSVWQRHRSELEAVVQQPIRCQELRGGAAAARGACSQHWDIWGGRGNACVHWDVWGGRGNAHVRVSARVLSSASSTAMMA
eukprot:354850-Chlamydomonas_euryale.AAC.4